MPSLSLVLSPSPAEEGSPQRRTRLCLARLLEAAAERDASRPAFRDQSNREVWTERPRFEWSYGVARSVVRRLAAFFAGLGLRPGTPVGVYLPGGSEACLTVLALEHAGLLACLFPIAWTNLELTQALELTGAEALVTQGALGDDRPAERVCGVAAGYYGLRFVCAFGPHVPDGVFELDPAMLEDGPLQEEREAASEGAVVTFARAPEGLRAVRRSTKSLIASAVTFLAATSIEPGDRILSLLAPDDHASLATGVAAALVSGATLECHGLFGGAALAHSLDGRDRTHLVAPGWLEAPLADSQITRGLASTILVHRAPVRFQAKTSLGGEVVDVLALGEIAAMARARDGSGRVRLSAGRSSEAWSPGQDLLGVRREEDGSVLVAGLAAEAREFTRVAADAQAPSTEWRDTGLKADVFAGMWIAVS